MKNFYSLLTSKVTLVVVILLFSGCTYWIYKNVKLSDLIGTQNVVSVTKTKTQTSGSEVAIKLEIRNGDILQFLSNDVAKLVVDHKTIPGVENILSVSYSVKTNKMCFIVETLTPEWMYLANTDGTSIQKVALASTCEVSPDGTKVAYINQVTDVSRTDVYLYTFSTGKSVNLTESINNPKYQRNYTKIFWVDDNALTADYKDWLISDYKTSISGTSIINILLGKVVDK